MLAIVIVAGLGVAEFARNDPGYLLINYGQWVIETSIIVVVIGLTLLFALLCIVWMLLKPIVKPLLWAGNQKKLQASVDTNLKNGMLCLADKDWEPAKSQLAKVKSRSPYYLIACLGCARAEYELGNLKSCDKYIAKAKKPIDADDKKSRQHIALFESQLAFDAARYEECLKHLKSLTSDKHNAQFLKLKTVSLFKTQQYHQTFALLDECRKNNVFSQSELVEIEAHCLAELIKDQNVDDAEQIWLQLPTHQREQSQLALIYFDFLSSHQETKKAEKLAQLHTRMGTDSIWASRYAGIEGVNWQEKYNLIQKYLGHHQDQHTQNALKTLELEGKEEPKLSSQSI